MPDNSTTTLPGTEEHLRPGEQWDAKNAMTVEPITVSVYLHRPDVGDRQFASREDAEQAVAATPSDLEAVRIFAQAQHLSVITADAPSRRVELQGTPEAVGKAFGVNLRYATDASGHRFLTYEGSIHLPAQLSHSVQAVLGLSQRTIAQHH